jgi:alpha-mannosidase
LVTRIQELRYWTDRDYIDLTGWTFDGQEIEIGASWPYRSGPVTFARAGVSVPDTWPLEDARLDLDLGGEGLVHVQYGEADDEQFGLDPHHERFPLRRRSFAVEACVVPRFPFGRPNRDARLRRARLVLLEPAVQQLVRQLYLASEAATALGNDHPAVVPMLRAAERALRSVDWPSDTLTYVSRVRDSTWLTDIWQAPEGLDPHPPGLTDQERATVEAASGSLRDAFERLRESYPQERSR